MKKMSFVTKGLALLLMGAMLAGCGDKATESTADDKQQESSVEDKSSESSEVKESTEEASTEESGAASSEESSAASTEESTQASVGATSYEEYFKNFSMEGKKLTLNLEEDVDGKKITVDMVVGNKDGNNFLYMSVPSKEEGKNNEMSAYFMKDQTAYAEFKVVGEDTVAQKTSGMDPAMADQLNLAGSFVNFSEDGDFSMKSLGQETIDGVTYEVLQIEGSEEAKFYVNAATKEWEILKASESGQEVVAYILPCEKIELPADYASAEEVGSEDFTMTLMYGMMGIIASVSGE